MKKNVLTLLFASAFTLLVGSCSTSYDATPGLDKSDIRNPFQGEFTGELNGVLFTADIKSFFDTTFINSRYVSLSGTQFTQDRDTMRNKTIQLVINNYEGPKVYYTQNTFSGAYIDLDSNVVRNYHSVSGDTVSAISVTNDQDRWAGTFNLMVVNNTAGVQDTIFISNGKFDIPK